MSDPATERLGASPADPAPTGRATRFGRKFVRHRVAMLSVVVFAVVLVLALNAERIAPYGFAEQNLLNSRVAPTFTDWHLFGTDRLGRDYFSRVLYGTQTSVLVALVVAALSTLIGTVVGAVAGYFGGRVDQLLMRFTDIVLVIPALAALLIIVAFLGQGSPYRVAVIVSLFLWTLVARIVRGLFLSLREQEFVDAARASGAGDLRIITRHMLPNAMSPIIVNATLTVAQAILIEAALSFLGVGIQPPFPALGNLIAEGRSAMFTEWWLVTMPGVVIVTICLSINFIGDGLRDALDPRQTQR